MKLTRFRPAEGHVRVGAIVDDEVVDLSAIADGDDVVRALASHRDALAQEVDHPATRRHALASVTLEAPVRPRKYFAIGLNYADHAREASLELPTVPTVFNKQPTSVIGPHEPIVRPIASDALDYEGEMAFVVGRRCRHVPAGRAREVIAGYLIANDVSIRDWQLATPTITMGKSWDTHGPLGPWLTTADEIEDPHALGISTWVNGELRQRSSTANLIFDCFALVEHLSTAFTLEPGDVVATGTPSGVGALMKPAPKFLVPGDSVRIEVDGLGVLQHEVVQETDDTPRFDSW